MVYSTWFVWRTLQIETDSPGFSKATLAFRCGRRTPRATSRFRIKFVSIFGKRPGFFHALRSLILARMSATTSPFGFAPCGSPWWRRTLTAPASMSRPPMASIVWTRNCSALEMFMAQRLTTSRLRVKLAALLRELTGLFFHSLFQRIFLGEAKFRTGRRAVSRDFVLASGPSRPTVSSVHQTNRRKSLCPPNNHWKKSRRLS